MIITPIHLLLLALPLALVDWQISLIWVIGALNPSLVAWLDDLPFQGFEVWFMFVSLGALRLFLFKGR